MASDPNVPINPPGGPYFTQRLWSEEVAIARAEAGDLGSNRDPSYEFGNGRKFVEPVNRVWGEGRAAPTLIADPVITGNNYDGSTLTSTTGTWDAYPVPEYAYQWTADGTNVGSNQNTYVTQVGDIGKLILCTVTATNEEGTASRGSNAITVTASASPSNTVAPVVSGSQPAGSTLTSTTGTWTANPAVSSYSYQWKADAGNVGTNQATYVTQVGDVGKSITCTVTATNVKGSGSQASNGVTVTAALASPANTVAPVISGDTSAGSTLTSTTGTWTGNPTPTYGYQWKSDGANVGSNQNTYVTQEEDVDADITCTVTATNSEGFASQVSNAITVTVSNPDAVIEALFANSEVGAWYDPSDLTTMFQDRAGTTPVTADGQTVGKILDKSGTDYHLTAPNDAARPLYKTSGGLHWLQFDGVNNLLSMLAIDFSSTDKLFALFGVYRNTNSGGMIAELGDFTANAGTFAFYNNSTDLIVGINGSASAGRQTSGIAYSYGSAYLTGAQFDISKASITDEVLLLANGCEHPSGTYFGTNAGTGNFSSSQNLVVGKHPDNSLMLDGRIYQFIICGRVLSTSEKESTSDYINVKSGGSAYVTNSGCCSIGDSIAVPILPLITTTKTKYTVAISGNTTAQQIAEYGNFAYKGNLSWVVIQSGINDLAILTTSQIITGLQSLVDYVKRYSRSSTKILIAKMTPCKQALIDTYGAVLGDEYYLKWVDVNQAIAGNGATPITGVDGRVTSHEATLNDGSGNLAAAYDDGSHLHLNNTGDQVIADAWVTALQAIGVTV